MNKRIVVLGAAGIIGQTMRLHQPEGLQVDYCRTKRDLLHRGVNITNQGELLEFLDHSGEPIPDVIINLAGESRPDVVERDPARHHAVNVQAPAFLSRWCDQNDSHLIQVSTQAVYGGFPRNVPADMAHKLGPPYEANSPRIPVNQYGAQKLAAEQEVAAAGKRWTILRPTFVMGVRPMPAVGRENPLEQMLGPAQVIAEAEAAAVMRQVNDRWFSVAFAHQIAKAIWKHAQGEPSCLSFNIGIPYRTNRHILASYLRPDLIVEPVSHDSFEGLAQRPIDTTYGPLHSEGWRTISDCLEQCREEYQQRMDDTIEQRAREISIFLGKDYGSCLDRLKRGFVWNHHQVTADWQKANPQTDEEILEWYRRTEAYIWELTTYHLDPGYNYSGMIRGISAALQARGGVKSVLCLGDGIGDLTMQLRRDGIPATYHDLNESRTAAFAEARYAMRGMPWNADLTCGWHPVTGTVESITGKVIADLRYDAIVSLDFLEHVTDVEAWVRGIHAALKPGGWFVAQNAFGIGSGEDGSMPMHLGRNDRFEKDWDPLLLEVGFRQECSNWYQKL
jgi:dTDP-4-dehydrorhamnose reductase/2-polyprenyl-3-methyl-5-hydroxy-6-metoxy-1,4-benzoquinol methylase